MNDPEKKALLGLCLVAAYADGEKSEPEQKQIQKAGDAFELGPLDLPEFYDHAASGLLSVQALAESLASREYRLLGYEMALGVCEADDHLSDRERAFLSELQRALGLDEATIQSAQATTRALQAQVMSPMPAAPAPPDLGTTPVSGIDRLILEHAVLCGALELLPETLATMAILPTQMRMVYRIGEAHGVGLDRGHIKEFIMTAGLGLTSQVIEGYANKLAKGLLGRFFGGLGRSAAGVLTGTSLSFVTTYALGHVAKQYYAGGRSLNATQIRAAFDSMMNEARSVYAQYAPKVEACSRNLKVQNLWSGAAS